MADNWAQDYRGLRRIEGFGWGIGKNRCWANYEILKNPIIEVLWKKSRFNVYRYTHFIQELSCKYVSFSLKNDL